MLAGAARVGHTGLVEAVPVGRIGLVAVALAVRNGLAVVAMYVFSFKLLLSHIFSFKLFFGSFKLKILLFSFRLFLE